MIARHEVPKQSRGGVEPPPPAAKLTSFAKPRCPLPRGGGKSCSQQMEEEVAITGITADSRKVEPGFLFVAIRGVEVDGAAYISDAVERGAVAVVCAPDTAVDVGVVVVRCEDPRSVLPLLAVRFYARQPETVVAITGTDGKTSVAHFCQQLWNLSGVRAVSTGTLGLVGVDDAELADLSLSGTSPDPVALHAALSCLVEKGVEAVALEASSHGLDQHRVDGVRIKAAACTNITRDHMDYHGTEAAYVAAKARLFAGGVAVGWCGGAQCG